MPSIMFVDIPAEQQGLTRWRVYQDRKCTHDYGNAGESLEMIIATAVDLHHRIIPRYVIVDAPVEIDQFIRDALCRRGVKIMVQPR